MTNPSVRIKNASRIRILDLDLKNEPTFCTIKLNDII